MRRGSHALGLLLAIPLAVGCSSGGDDAEPGAPATTAASYDGPASLANPLGSGLLGVDQNTLRRALLDGVSSAGGVRATVTGGRYDVVVEVDPTGHGDVPDPRRFTWTEDGVERVQLHVGEERVCVNRESTDALVEMLSGAMHGTVVLSDRPYSCTQPSYSSAFLSKGLIDLDPVGQLATIDEWSGVDDLGTEVDPDGVAVRHLSFDGVHGFTVERPMPWDLWVDADLHVVRIEYDGTRVATFEYGPVPPVVLPPAADRGAIRLVTYPVGSVGPPVSSPPSPTASPVP